MIPKGSSEFLKVDVPAPAFWTRVFMRADEEFANGHGTFIKTTKNGQEMRVGDHRCQLELNRDGGNGGDFEMTTGSYGNESTVCNETFGTRLQPDTWYCLETYFNGPESEIQVFWDNQHVQQLHVTEDRIATNDDKKSSSFASVPWGPHNYDSLEFGYTNYHGIYNRTIWFDNVATSTTRIGCGADYKVNEALDQSTFYNGYEQEEGLPAPVLKDVN